MNKLDRHTEEEHAVASRLSQESLTTILDAGQHGMDIVPGADLLTLDECLPAPVVDLDALLNAEDATTAVQAVAPQSLFLALSQRGPEDCLDILPLLSSDQVTRIFDYDAWDRDGLSMTKAMKWLNLFREISPEELQRRFRDLDEEYQLALLSPLVTLVDEDEFERLSGDEQDRLNRLPCGTLYYRLNSDDPKVEDFIGALIDAFLASDVGYAYALLTNAAYQPPNENEALITRFRQARLEEDGFVTHAESLAAFQPLDIDELRRQWAFKLHLELPPSFTGVTASASRTGLFLARVLRMGDGAGQDQGQQWSSERHAEIRQGLVALANSLCAAAQIEPDDTHGVRRLLQHAQATVSLGLEFLAGDDLKAGREILLGEAPKNLFRVGITLCYRLAHATLAHCAHQHLPQAEALLSYLQRDKRALLSDGIDRWLLPSLGFEACELLKGVCNRFPVRLAATPPTSRTLDGNGHLSFSPVATLSDLVDLAARLDTLTGLMFVANLANPDHHLDDKCRWGDSLTTSLQTALARVGLGGELNSAPLSADEVQQFLATPTELSGSRLAELLRGIDGSLKLAQSARVTPDGQEVSDASTSIVQPDNHWVVSATAGIHVKDPAAGVGEALTAMIQDLTMAWRNAQDGLASGRLTMSTAAEALHGVIAITAIAPQ